MSISEKSSSLQEEFKEETLSEMPSVLKFLVAMGIAMLSFFLIMGFGALASSFIFDIGILDYFSVADLPADVVNGVVKMQYATQTVGLFGLIPLTFMVVFYKRRFASFLKINTTNFYSMIPLVVIAVIISIPFINFIAEFNSLLFDVMLGEDNYFKLLRDVNEEATKEILETNSVFSMLGSIVVVAILPGIFEEVCFRGGVQNFFMKRFKSYHAAIIITGFVFALSHFEFYGIISRTLMGVMFGYLYYWTKNLWIPIFAHIANNAAIVILNFYIYNNVIDGSIETLGGDSDTMMYGLLSGIVSTILFFIVYRLINKPTAEVDM